MTTSTTGLSPTPIISNFPGKKAWTWGYGGYGKMHQMELTDDDGPYNEVPNRAPLLTQAQVGRLGPLRGRGVERVVVSPFMAIGGFTFANEDVAVEIRSVYGGKLRLRMLGSGAWGASGRFRLQDEQGNLAKPGGIAPLSERKRAS